MGVYTVTAGGLATAALVRRYFPSQDWLTMIAVADAESTFTPGAINPSGATGLFQIEYWKWGTTQAAMLNAAANTQMAAHILATQGIQAWNGDGYQAYLGIAQTLLARTATTSAVTASVVTATTFGVNGSAYVTPGGRIIGRVTIRANGGSIPYRVTMQVSPSYESSYPTSTTAAGTAPANQTVTVSQSLIAPLPPPSVIRAHQQVSPGSVAFPFDVSWTVTDTRTNQSRTISGGQRVSLTVQ